MLEWSLPHHFQTERSPFSAKEKASRAEGHQATPTSPPSLMTLKKRGPPLGTQFTLLPSKSSADHKEAPGLVRGKWCRNPNNVLLGKSATYIEPTRATSSAKRKRLASSSCTARYRRSSSLCRTPGSVPKQTRFSAMQTGMTLSGFMMLLKLSTDLNPLGLPPSFDLLELPCSLKRDRSWRDKLHTLTVSSTAPLQSITQPLNTFHRFWWTWNSTLFRWLKKWGKPSSKCPSGKPQDRTQSLLSCTRLVALSCFTRSPTSFGPHGPKSNS